MLTGNVPDPMGNTPLICLWGERIYTKAESLNPDGSIEDRIALAQIEGAEHNGRQRHCLSAIRLYTPAQLQWPLQEACLAYDTACGGPDGGGYRPSRGG